MFTEEIFKIKMDPQGSILIIAILALAIMLFLGAYLASSMLTGFKMSDSYTSAIKVYYLAEAGAAEAIFKLKNDSGWKAAFETLPTAEDPSCSSWSISPYSRTSALFEGGEYSITLQNIGCAKAEISVQAKILGSSKVIAQRIVKVKVFKAMGNAVSEFSIFTGGSSENIDIKSTAPLNIYQGSLFSNNIINIKSGSQVNVENKALANGNIIISGGSYLNSTGTCAANICEGNCIVSEECPPDDISMPPLDIDSESSGSYLSRAESSDCSFIRTDGETNCVFSPEEFENLMWDNYPVLSLPTGTVSYVTGDINIRAGQKLIVNGVIASDRDVNIGRENCWVNVEPPFLRCGASRVISKRPGNPDDNFPSGILAKRKFNTGNWLGYGLSALDIEGLLYSGDEMKLSSIGALVKVRGGIAVRKLSLSSMWNGVDIYLDQDVIVDTFQNPEYSPLITIDHWEEEY